MMSSFDHVDSNICKQSNIFFSVLLHTINLCALLGGILISFEKLCTPVLRSSVIAHGQFLQDPNRSCWCLLSLGGCRAAGAGSALNLFKKLNVGDKGRNGGANSIERNQTMG